MKTKKLGPIICSAWLWIGLLVSCNSQENTNPSIVPGLSATAQKSLPTLITQTDSVETVATTVGSLTPTPKPSKTLAPTQTLQPSASSTPTITPTFDAAHIVTRTLAPAVLCPIENPALTPDIATWYVQEGYQHFKAQTVLDYMNSGGTIPSVINAFRKEYDQRIATPALRMDVTGDGVDELLITNDASVLILGCQEGEYRKLLQVDGDQGFVRFTNFEMPEDMNLDGIPEIVVNIMHGTNNANHTISVYEWDGSQFIPILQSNDSFDKEVIPYAEVYGATKIEIKDSDGNGTLELVLTSNPPIYGTSDYIYGLPWRDETHVFGWNGNSFVLFRITYSPPEYRFQAVQDGDRATLLGDYDAALDYYQQAIFSDQLDGWSYDRWEYEVMQFAAIGDETPTPIPTPSYDGTEYYNLAAYSRFRILLLHTRRGWIPEAGIVYNTLKEKFLPGQPGYAYVEMATAFWDEYQASTDLSRACQKAIEYTTVHSDEILSSLGEGNSIFGSQSLDYVPEDVCPFR